MLFHVKYTLAYMGLIALVGMLCYCGLASLFAGSVTSVIFGFFFIGVASWIYAEVSSWIFDNWEVKSDDLP